MPRVPDLVADSNLETEFGEGYTAHIWYDASEAPLARPRKEYWRERGYVGKGAYGSVWLEECADKQRVPNVRAVKRVIVGEPASNNKDCLRELEAIAKFSQKKYERCFVKSYGWYERSGTLYIAMEFFPLGDLHKCLQQAQDQKLPEDQAKVIALQLLDGLNYMHSSGFAHRDLKPNNILVKSLTPIWIVKISDFGTSKRIEQSRKQPGTLVGTVEYLAPEANPFLFPKTNMDTIDGYAADMWSLGELTVRILTHEPSFEDGARLLEYVHNKQPFPTSRLDHNGVTPMGQRFLISLMAALPDERLTAAVALNHQWLEQYRPQHTSAAPPSLTETDVQRLAETWYPSGESTMEYATWSSHVEVTAAPAAPQRDKHQESLRDHPESHIPLGDQQVRMNGQPLSVVASARSSHEHVPGEPTGLLHQDNAVEQDGIAQLDTQTIVNTRALSGDRNERLHENAMIVTVPLDHTDPHESRPLTSTQEQMLLLTFQEPTQKRNTDNSDRDYRKKRRRIREQRRAQMQAQDNHQETQTTPIEQPSQRSPPKSESLIDAQEELPVRSRQESPPHIDTSGPRPSTLSSRNGIRPAIRSALQDELWETDLGVSNRSLTPTAFVPLRDEIQDHRTRRQMPAGKEGREPDANDPRPDPRPHQEPIQERRAERETPPTRAEQPSSGHEISTSMEATQQRIVLQGTPQKRTNTLSHLGRPGSQWLKEQLSPSPKLVKQKKVGLTPQYPASLNLPGALSPTLHTMASTQEEDTRQRTQELKGHGSWVNSVAFKTADEHTLASGSSDGTVRLWDTQTGQMKKLLGKYGCVVEAVTFSLLDANMLASSSYNPEVRLWDTRTGRSTQRLSGHSECISSVAFSPSNGYTFASGSWDKYVKLWDLRTSQPVETLKGHSGAVNSVAFSPDGLTLVSGSDDSTIRVWDSQTAETIHLLKGPSKVITSVASSPSRNTIASSSWDGTVRQWDVETGTTTQQERIHAAHFLSVAFSPTGHLLASASTDNLVRLWNVRTEQAFRPLAGHSNWVSSVAFSPNGQMLASGSLDGTVRLWGVANL